MLKSAMSVCESSSDGGPQREPSMDGSAAPCGARGVTAWRERGARERERAGKRVRRGGGVGGEA